MTDTTRAEMLIADIERLADARCACAAPLCGHALLFSFLLGYKSEPRCVVCLAKELGRDVDSLSAHLVDWVRHRDCHRAAWDWTSAREGDCPLASLVPSSPPDQVVAAPVAVRAEFDAGDMGCGDLALELRIQLKSLAAGDVIQVLARDPGAPADIPAWCRMTGNLLVYQDHPVYLIQKQEV